MATNRNDAEGTEQRSNALDPRAEVGNAIARFLTARAERRPLQATAIRRDVAPRRPAVTVYGEDDPQGAAEPVAGGDGPEARTGVDREQRDDGARTAGRNAPAGALSADRGGDGRAG